MDPAELVRLYPRLHHVAEAGSWPSIRDNGLLTSAQLCDLYGVSPERRRELLHVRRPDKARLDHPGRPAAVLRDQGPLSTAKLAACLQGGTTVEAWLGALNNRVFFWLQTNRLERMLKAYADQDHDVLTVDSAALLDRHADRVRLSRINSGSTAYAAQPRGPGTFQTVEDYPHPARTRPRAAATDVAELCVFDGLHDIADLVVAVERRRGTTVVELLHIGP